MEDIQALDMPVQDWPSFTPIKKAWKHACFVHSHLGTSLYGFAPKTPQQHVECFGCSRNPAIDLFVQRPVTRKHAAQVYKVIFHSNHIAADMHFTHWLCAARATQGHDLGFWHANTHAPSLGDFLKLENHTLQHPGITSK
jgi:hypothetical protein